MSVLVPDLKVYEAMYRKAWTYQFKTQVDIDYCHVLSLPDDELQRHVKNWLYLNELSFIRRYREKDEPKLHEFLTFKNGETISSYQMLKFLQCVQYNIELNTIKNGYSGLEPKIHISEDMKESYNLLADAIKEISHMIVSQLDEYKQANWSEI